MTTDQFFSLVGQLLTAGGGGALVAFALFKFLGRNWIEHELSKKLEAAKAEMGVLTARRMKLHDREYIVFPEVWSKLNKAVSTLGAAIISFRQFPDFNRQTQEERDDWLARSDLYDEERDYFTRENDKIHAYSRILDFRALRDAGQAFNDFRECFHANRIFISPAIKSKRDQIDDQIKESWIAKKMDMEGLSRGGDTNWLLKAHETHEKADKTADVGNRRSSSGQAFSGRLIPLIAASHALDCRNDHSLRLMYTRRMRALLPVSQPSISPISRSSNPLCMSRVANVPRRS